MFAAKHADAVVDLVAKENKYEVLLNKGTQNEKNRSSKASVGTDSSKELRAAQARLKAYEQKTAGSPIVSRSVGQNYVSTRHSRHNNDGEAYQDAWNKLNHRYRQLFIIQKALRDRLA